MSASTAASSAIAQVAKVPRAPEAVAAAHLSATGARQREANDDSPQRAEEPGSSIEDAEAVAARQTLQAILRDTLRGESLGTMVAQASHVVGERNTQWLQELASRAGDCRRTLADGIRKLISEMPEPVATTAVGASKAEPAETERGLTIETKTETDPPTKPTAATAKQKAEAAALAERQRTAEALKRAKTSLPKPSTGRSKTDDAQATKPADAERKAAGHEAVERAAAERLEAERRATERVAAERQAAERTAAQRQAAEHAAAERLVAERQATERAAAQRQAADRRAAAESVDGKVSLESPGEASDAVAQTRESQAAGRTRQLVNLFDGPNSDGEDQFLIGVHEASGAQSKIDEPAQTKTCGKCGRVKAESGPDGQHATEASAHDEGLQLISVYEAHDDTVQANMTKRQKTRAKKKACDAKSSEDAVRQLVNRYQEDGHLVGSPEMQRALQAAGLESKFEEMQASMLRDLEQRRERREREWREEQAKEQADAYADFEADIKKPWYDEQGLRNLLLAFGDDEQKCHIIRSRLREMQAHACEPENERPPGEEARTPNLPC